MCCIQFTRHISPPGCKMLHAADSVTAVTLFILTAVLAANQPP